MSVGPLLARGPGATLILRGPDAYFRVDMWGPGGAQFDIPRGDRAVRKGPPYIHKLNESGIKRR